MARIRILTRASAARATLPHSLHRAMAFATGIATLAVVPAVVLLQANPGSVHEAPARIAEVPLAAPASGPVEAPTHVVIVVSNAEQAARISESFATEQTLAFPEAGWSMSFEMMVLDGDVAVEELRLRIEDANGLLAGIGREVAFVDARTNAPPNGE